MHAKRVTAELELSAERREFGTEAADMARGAISASLLRERGNGLCGPVDAERRAE